MSLTDHRTVLQKVLAEGTSQTLTGSLLDQNKAPIAAADLSTMTMTLFDAGTAAIINGRDDTDILGVNGGSVLAGAWQLDLTPEDMVILASANKTEVHVLLVEWTATNGKKGKAVVILTVDNLTKVP